MVFYLHLSLWSIFNSLMVLLGSISVCTRLLVHYIYFVLYIAFKLREQEICIHSVFYSYIIGIISAVSLGLLPAKLLMLSCWKLISDFLFEENLLKASFPSTL